MRRDSEEPEPEIFYEEAYRRPGAPRPHYAEVLEDLTSRDLRELEQRVTEGLAHREVSFGEAGGTAPFVVDPVPRVITASEWRSLEAGLAQRARALSAFVRDAYWDQGIVAAGVLPAHVIRTAAYFEPALRRSAVTRTATIAVAGMDVVRDETGRFLVLEDNVRTPSGVAYAVAAREALDPHLPVPAPSRRRAVADGFALLGAALRAAGPDPGSAARAVVLTDGPRNTAWYEHRTLAERLGLPLVLPRDLDTGADGLYARVEGKRVRVDVVYRRTDEDRLMDDAGHPTAVGALLDRPWRRGQLGLVNAFGVGVADDKLAHAYVEDMIRFYLGEEPLLPSVPTHDLSDPEVRQRALARIGELVIKPREASGGHGILIGPHATPEDRARVAERVRARPDGYVAQEMVALSRHPTVVEGRLEPRHVDLRAFVFQLGDRIAVLPGGLTRVALGAGSLVVNSSQGGGGKDTWVLAADPEGRPEE